MDEVGFSSRADNTKPQVIRGLFLEISMCRVRYSNSPSALICLGFCVVMHT